MTSMNRACRPFFLRFSALLFVLSPYASGAAFAAAAQPTQNQAGAAVQKTHVCLYDGRGDSFGTDFNDDLKEYSCYKPKWSEASGLGVGTQNNARGLDGALCNSSNPCFKGARLNHASGEDFAPLGPGKGVTPIDDGNYCRYLDRTLDSNEDYFVPFNPDNSMEWESFLKAAPSGVLAQPCARAYTGKDGSFEACYNLKKGVARAGGCLFFGPTSIRTDQTKDKRSFGDTGDEYLPVSLPYWRLDPPEAAKANPPLNSAAIVDSTGVWRWYWPPKGQENSPKAVQEFKLACYEEVKVPKCWKSRWVDKADPICSSPSVCLSRFWETVQSPSCPSPNVCYKWIQDTCERCLKYETVCDKYKTVCDEKDPVTKKCLKSHKECSASHDVCVNKEYYSCPYCSDCRFHNCSRCQEEVCDDWGTDIKRNEYKWTEVFNFSAEAFKGDKQAVNWANGQTQCIGGTNKATRPAACNKRCKMINPTKNAPNGHDAECWEEKPWPVRMPCPDIPPPSDPACGTADGASFVDKPSAGLCGAGTASAVTSAAATWNWNCSKNGKSVACSAKIGCCWPWTCPK